MASLWDEDLNTYEKQYWRNRQSLGMTKKTRDRDVEYLSQWLKAHPYLPSLVGVDEKQWLDNYLFLNKNNLQRTKENLKLYFKLRTTVPEGFRDRSPRCPDMQKSFDAVCLATIPKLTDEGRMVCVFHHLNTRTGDFEIIPLGKRMISMIDIYLRHGIHRAGSVIVLDLENFRFGHLTRYQPVRLVRAFFSYVWTAYPERISQIHIINPPIILHAGLAFFRPFLKEKIRKRIMVHSNIEYLYEHVPRTHLPSEYGGLCGSLNELNRKWEKIMTDHEEWLDTCGQKHKIPDDKWFMVE